ncbi:MAG: DUF1844 domain-containing protein [Myxococcota bacterium]
MAEREADGEGKGFKVVDRRRFGMDGEEREGVVERPAAPAPGPAAGHAAATAKPMPSAPSPAPAPAPEEADEADDGGLTFSVFVQSLAQQCMLQLGMIPMPHSGQRELQLEGARDTIEVLDLMRAKTKGNLTPQEASLLEGVLYELRMTYVQINQQLAARARQPGPPGAGPLR